MPDSRMSGTLALERHLPKRRYSTPAGWHDQAGAARFMGVTVATIRRWSRKQAGALPFYRIGHRALYREEDLRTWLEAHRVVNPINDNRRAA